LSFMPLLGGLDPEVGWESLQLLEKVMPRLRHAKPATARTTSTRED
jgi:hypothetical protein